MKRNRRNFRYRNRRNNNFPGRNSLISTIVTAIAGVVTKDLLSDNSRIKGFIKGVFQPQKLENKSSREIIDADYDVLQDENKIKIDKNKENLIEIKKENSGETKE